MQKITKAILAVMKEVKGVEKTLDVGTGRSSYKGVADKAVKEVIGKSMQKNGLVILPTGIEAKTEISRWETSGQYGTQQKQSVFTEVKTKYMLLHESGESIELTGYGHGVDPQDKGAGKATTYALKYTLLYAFLVPTGKIDDTDNTHSKDVAVRKPVAKKKPVVKLDAENVKKIESAPDLETLATVCKDIQTKLGDKYRKSIISHYTARKNSLEQVKNVEENVA